MSQGKAWNKEEVIEALRPYFKLGCSVTKACRYAGFPQSTVATWVENDDELRLKIEAWQNEISTLARQTIRKNMEEGNLTAALEWVKRKDKDEFSEKTETDITSKGESIKVDASEAIKIAKEYESRLKGQL